MRVKSIDDIWFKPWHQDLLMADWAKYTNNFLSPPQYPKLHLLDNHPTTPTAWSWETNRNGTNYWRKERIEIERLDERGIVH